jgi:methylated-DNA-[protein]-cysteine S-methyltransferase
MTTFTILPATPVGELMLTSDGIALTGVFFEGHSHPPKLAAGALNDPSLAVFEEAIKQLNQYFEEGRRQFDLPLAPIGTVFQQSVWQRLREIPAGTTVSYGSIAHSLGQPTASRAVGAAVGRNPLSIIVPCHRVVGSTGKLTGFAGGTDRKRWLLELETGLFHGANR